MCNGEALNDSICKTDGKTTWEYQFEECKSQEKAHAIREVAAIVTREQSAITELGTGCSE